MRVSFRIASPDAPFNTQVQDIVLAGGLAKHIWLPPPARMLLRTCVIATPNLSKTSSIEIRKHQQGVAY
jgi:hypothetical protein